MKKIFGMITVLLMCVTLAGTAYAATPDIAGADTEIICPDIAENVGTAIVITMDVKNSGTELSVNIVDRTIPEAPTVKIENKVVVVSCICPDTNGKSDKDYYWYDLMDSSHWRTYRYHIHNNS